MKISHVLSQPSKFIDYQNQVRPIEIPCKYHNGSVCLNYCQQVSCFKLLCEECIEEHLEHHKKSGLSSLAIKSFKKVRQGCVLKLNKLIQDLIGRVSNLKQPKSPQQMLNEAHHKFEIIKKTLFEIIEQELSRFYEELKSKINQSISMIKSIEEIHHNFESIISQLQESKTIIIDGTQEIPKKIEEVLMMNEKLYTDAFDKESVGYMQKLAYVDFDISMSQSKFRSSINQCLKIVRKELNEVPIGNDYSRINRSASSRLLENNSHKRSLSSSSFQIKQASQIKLLHYFESGGSCLNLYDISSKKIKCEKIYLQNYIVPSYHCSILVPKSYIFISGGIEHENQQEVKSSRLSKYSLKAKGNEAFKKDFAPVLPRSSHSLCEHGEHLYILGGYGRKTNENVEIVKNLEMVNIRTGKVEELESSRYGGSNISMMINDYIVKSSEEGVEMFHTLNRKWTSLKVSSNYEFIRGCGWTKISKDTVLIYGGYDNSDEALDSCQQWKFSDSQLVVQEMQFKLPFAQVFGSNPGIVSDGNVYALQDEAEDEDQEEDVELGKILLCFDGFSWKKVPV